MHTRRLLHLGAAVLLVLVFSLPATVSAGHRSPQGITVVGTVVSKRVAANAPALLLSEQRARGDRLWIVRLGARTELEFRGAGFQAGDVDAIMAAIRVGDVVEVAGRREGDRQIRAHLIEIRGHARVGGSFIFRPAPVPVRPAPVIVTGAPVILHPASGAVIRSRRFIVVGRAIPHATLTLQIVMTFGNVQFTLATTTVVTDARGFFAHEVEPAFWFPGATLQLIVATVAPARTGPTIIIVRMG